MGFFRFLFEFPADSSLLLRPLIGDNGEARSRMFADDLPYLGQRHYVLLNIVFLYIKRKELSFEALFQLPFMNEFNMRKLMRLDLFPSSVGLNTRSQCILFSVVFTPSPPSTTRQCLAPTCRFSNLTLHCIACAGLPIHIFGEVS